MTDAPVLLAPDALPARHAAEQTPSSGAVALLLDDGVAAIAAASWAARLAAEKRTSLLVVVLLPHADSPDEDAAALVARVRPTLDRHGVAHTVHACRWSAGRTSSGRVRRTARRVAALLAPQTGLLVCSGATAADAGPGQGLALPLAAERGVDLLVVPDLSSLGDSRSGEVPDEPGRSRPDRAL